MRDPTNFFLSHRVSLIDSAIVQLLQRAISTPAPSPGVEKPLHPPALPPVIFILPLPESRSDPGPDRTMDALLELEPEPEPEPEPEHEPEPGSAAPSSHSGMAMPCTQPSMPDVKPPGAPVAFRLLAPPP